MSEAKLTEAEARKKIIELIHGQTNEFVMLTGVSILGGLVASAPPGYRRPLLEHMVQLIITLAEEAGDEHADKK